MPTLCLQGELNTERRWYRNLLGASEKGSEMRRRGAQQVDLGNQQGSSRRCVFEGGLPALRWNRGERGRPFQGRGRQEGGAELRNGRVQGRVHRVSWAGAPLRRAREEQRGKTEGQLHSRIQVVICTSQKTCGIPDHLWTVFLPLILFPKRFCLRD